ncbi:MAG: ribosome small subunit-dependent GTPase A [Halothiobacillus sp. 14-56-357]|jgi:ribosome biogenesis GTPase|uniref:ribosome small subunit-dependent GTPase A n=1 Tax=Halothiobacillus sp. 15-55-196 TaxID=1970382 RepID=UPI000BD27DCD|nr:ribosome small subunit-dependent GTPase A [Halothiobacillus sp. 15-55-196]OZB37065.1 MAG: ribosome small subunit-dependent GTPase A [Halothiobacillus sp. 15-55-196]OZB56923.1 MAG: ribosome small subunit-dependent GTPase A [Halothiobacillus sp. 14-56-357]OZB79114.1 MAG: ribosome small subunit-dependent GTPase A [Halothiobacillus sp. 13-55-115]
MKIRLTDRQKNQIANRLYAPDESLERATVVTHHGTELIIENVEGKLLRANARRTLGVLTTGDRVGWRTGEDARQIIEFVYPRSNTLIRPDTHGKARLMAANIDQVLIILAPTPWMNPNVVERTLVATLDLPATPIIVLNKIDLLATTQTEHQALIEQTLALWAAQDINIVRISTKTGEGLNDLRNVLDDKISMMIGLSGVGKTSLARSITAQAATATINELSAHSQEGQHTTRHSTLFRLDHMQGGLIDAPGVRDFAVAAQNAQAIDRAFPDILKLAEGCRFYNCTHSQEPSCAVQAAVANGQLDSRRFENYQSLKRECPH